MSERGAERKWGKFGRGVNPVEKDEADAKETDVERYQRSKEEPVRRRKVMSRGEEDLLPAILVTRCDK